MRVLVLGAGVVGVATAYHLARQGHEVTVVDRQPGPGLETSFANGGQISANHATPWAGPTTPWKALKWLGRDEAPLLFRARFDPALASWLIRFLANCTIQRLRVNTERALRVAVYSRQQLAELRAATNLQYDQLKRGILHIFRDKREYDQALPQIALMDRYGCHRRVISVDECVAIEPALAHVRSDLVGGIFSPDDESGDAHAFTAQLSKIAASMGVAFRYSTSIRRLRRADGRVGHVETDAGELLADAYVLALGSFSPLVLKDFRLRLPVYPAKGYSVTLPVGDRAAAPVVSLIDDEFKMVYSRLGERLRIAGTAEFVGYDCSVRESRARFLLNKALELFPGCGDPAAAQFWAGLRPSTPDGVPILGRTPYSNLFLNTGHGTLGWTMACGSGRIIADLVSGRTPDIALDGLGIERFLH